MMANNEVGTIQPIKEMLKIIQEMDSIKNQFFQFEPDIGSNKNLSVK